MLDSIEKLDALPIFPLDAVLFPGAVLPLHIFEERYKIMIRFAMDNEGLFGLSYRADAEVGRETVLNIGSVGCIAKINGVMPLEEGRMNIITTGVVRYRVVDLKQIVPFLTARVEILQDEVETNADSDSLFEAVKHLCQDFLSLAGMASEAGSRLEQYSTENAQEFSLLISSLLPIDNESKQSLLETTSTKLRLTRLRQYVKEALADYNKSQLVQSRAKKNGHGTLQL